MTAEELHTGLGTAYLLFLAAYLWIFYQSRQKRK